MDDGDAMVAVSSGGAMQRFVHGNGEDPLIRYDGATLANRYSLQTDAEGSIVSQATTSGVLSGNILSYDEYGIPGTSNDGVFQYTGQMWLPSLGMYHYKARIYSPTLGRFLQVDPIGYEDQVNLYGYVGNDPIDGRDPNGTCGPCVAAVPFIIEGAGEAFELYETIVGIHTVVNVATMPKPRYRPPLRGSPYRRPRPDPRPTVHHSDIYDTDGVGKIGGNPADVPVGDSELPDAIGQLDRSIAQRKKENDRFPRGNPNGDKNQRTQWQRYRGHMERIAREVSLRQALIERLRKLTK